ncbi:unnamed protein product [Lampetra planeri]
MNHGHTVAESEKPGREKEAFRKSAGASAGAGPAEQRDANELSITGLHFYERANPGSCQSGPSLARSPVPHTPDGGREGVLFGFRRGRGSQHAERTFGSAAPAVARQRSRVARRCMPTEREREKEEREADNTEADELQSARAADAAVPVARLFKIRRLQRSESEREWRRGLANDHGA